MLLCSCVYVYTYMHLRMVKLSLTFEFLDLRHAGIFSSTAMTLLLTSEMNIVWSLSSKRRGICEKNKENSVSLNCKYNVLLKSVILN